MTRPYMKITVDYVKELEKNIQALADRRVLAGFPQQTDRRQGDPIGNAEIGYIQNYGEPAMHIPARPFMEPAAADIRDKAVRDMQETCLRVLDPKNNGNAELDKGLHRVGLLFQLSIRNRLNSDTPPPLAPATVAARIARRKSSQWRVQRRMLIAGNVADPNHPATAAAPGIGVFRTLVDTGKLLHAVTYVIRERKTNRDRAIGKQL